MTIDWWTIGLQAVNVLILVWLLGRFFWRPVSDMIAKRQAAAQELIAAAQATHDQADAVLAEVTRARAAMAQERDDVLLKAQEDAQKALDASLLQAAQQVQALRDTAQADISKLHEAAESLARERAAQLAVVIAQRLAIRLDGQVVREAFLGWLLQSIQALPQTVRQTVVSSGTAELVSSAPLTPAEQIQHTQQINQVFGGFVRLNFSTDPGLIAGLELHGGEVRIENSWRADLASIRKEINDVQRA
jgi:F-type H+-transporting ATPase subunit b